MDSEKRGGQRLIIYLASAILLCLIAIIVILLRPTSQAQNSQTVSKPASSDPIQSQSKSAAENLANIDSDVNAYNADLDAISQNSDRFYDFASKKQDIAAWKDFGWTEKSLDQRMTGTQSLMKGEIEDALKLLTKLKANPETLKRYRIGREMQDTHDTLRVNGGRITLNYFEPL